jgi:hypothetical protein
MMAQLNRLIRWIGEHQWPVFIVLVLAIAISLTSVSLWLYHASSTAKLDLSRPGYEQVREDVKDSSDSTKPFSPTGNLNEAAIADFRSRYEGIKNRLDQINNYDSLVMSDKNLGLVAGEAVTEPI